VPFNLPLPAFFNQARWKVKIREKEQREPPHATVLRGTKAWRIDLRTGEFMDRRPDSAEIPPELIEYIKAEENWRRLCEAWDLKYPTNPVQQTEDTEDE